MTADPLARFEAEHQEALAMLDRLDAASGALEASGDPAAALATVREVLAFLSSAVRQHNENEERALFTVLEEPDLTAPFVTEHVRLRNLERQLTRALEASDAVARIPRVTAELIGVLRDHIAREDGMLFPHARSVLGAEGLAAVAARLR